MTSSLNTGDATLLLNSAKYLNSLLLIGNQSVLTNKIQENQNNLDVQASKLDDLKDAISTYNREFIEREKSGDKPPVSRMQDWGLFIFFAGYAAFAFCILLYIFRMPPDKNPFYLALTYIFLNAIIYTCFVFIIQRFG